MMENEYLEKKNQVKNLSCGYIVSCVFEVSLDGNCGLYGDSWSKHGYEALRELSNVHGGGLPVALSWF